MRTTVPGGSREGHDAMAATEHMPDGPQTGAAHQGADFELDTALPAVGPQAAIPDDAQGQSVLPPGPTRGLRPTTDWDLNARVNSAFGSAWWWNEKHDILAGR